MRWIETILASSLAVGAVACEDEELFLETQIAPTEIAVDPVEFLGGDVTCSKNEGAMQSYVLTLHSFDDEFDSTPFQLGASLAASCALPVGFRNVVLPGTLYIAEVDAYELPAAQLTPVFGANSGARQMTDVLSGDPVSPRWTTRCGHSGADAVEAVVDVKRFIAPCDALVDHGSSGATMAIDPRRVLGDDACATASEFDIMSLEGGLGDQLAIPCDADPVVLPVVVGRSYRLQAKATSALGVVYGASCTAMGIAGQQSLVACDPLMTHGALRIDLADPKTGKSANCPDGSSYRVVHQGSALTPVPVKCGEVAHIGGLTPSLYQVNVDILDAQGQASGETVKCAAEIEAGLTVDAACAL